MLKAQLDYRASLLFDQTGNVALKTGEIYIFTQPVKSQNIPQGYRVILNSFDPKAGTVDLDKVGPGKKNNFTMSIEDFNKVTMTEEALNNVPNAPEQYEPTQAEVDNITASMSVISDELSDFEQLAQWNDEAIADNITPDDLKDDFFTNFKC